MNSKEEKIAFFVPTLDGGIGKVTTILASGMKASGKDVEIWSAAPKNKTSFNLFTIN